MKPTNEQIKKAKQAKSVEELQALAAENGIELTEENAKKCFDQLHKEGMVADEELENVTGGSCMDDLDNEWNMLWGDYTDIYCKGCNWTTTWSGYFSSMNAYAGPCPVCGASNVFAGKYHE